MSSPSEPFDPASLTYDSRGLIPAIAQQAGTGEILMLAWMNAASIERSLEEGRAVYWSRSRQSFWRKGDTSGHIQKLLEIRVDCDRDALVLIVEQTGKACHLGVRTCFHRAVRRTAEGPVESLTAAATTTPGDAAGEPEPNHD